MTFLAHCKTSASGNLYINAKVHYMTKNMEAAGVPDKSSTTTAEFFDREVICPPAEALSDQGGEFQGDLPALLARQVQHKSLPHLS